MAQVPPIDPAATAVLAVGVLVPDAVALAAGSDSAPISHLSQWRGLTRGMNKESPRTLCYPSELPDSPR
jgi:hypothetical protein